MPDLARAREADLLTTAGRPRDALNLLRPLLGRSTEHPMVLEQVARAHAKLGQYSEVLRVAQRLGELTPGSSAGPFWGSVALTALAQWQQARLDAAIAIDLEPELARNHAALGDALLAGPSEGHEAAVESYARAIELDPDNPAWHLSYASALITMADDGDPMLARDAGAHLRHVLETDPKNPGALREQARLQILRGHRAAGLQGLAEVLKHDPHDRASEQEVLKVLRTSMGLGLATVFALYQFLDAARWPGAVPYLIASGIVILIFIVLRAAVPLARVDRTTRRIVWAIAKRNIPELAVAIATTTAVAGMTTYLVLIQLGVVVR